MRTAVQPASQGPADTTLEAYFLKVLESQPVCLTRIADDGTFLAVNEAAMSLLGAERLEQILETSLLTLVAADDREQCLAFLKRVTNGDRGSAEVELTGLAGLQHTLQIHAVAIAGSPDALPAAFCTFRDITEHRRLERALMDAAAREEEQASALSAERERLNAALAATRQAATAGTASAAEKARAAALETALADAESRQRDLGEQHAARHAQLFADFETAQQQFEASLAEQLARLAEKDAALLAAEARERELTSQLSGGEQAWQTALAQAAAEHDVQSNALRQAIAGLEQAAREAEHGRDEAVARYDADRVAWEARSAADRQAAHTANAEATASIAALRQEIETLEAMQAAFAGERESLQRTAADAQAARSDLAARIAGATAERSALDAEIRALERNSRGARLALALAGDLETSLMTGADRGRLVLNALPAGDPSRSAAEAWLASTLEAGSVARRLRRSAQPAAPPAVAGRVVRSLEAALGALLSPDIALSVLVGSDDAHVDLSADQLEQLVLTFVAHRRTMLGGGGQISLEVADVDLDEECGREHGARPGAYVLLALHVAGAGAGTGVPDALFGAPGTIEAWRAAGPGLGGVVQLAQTAGGHAWATRVGPAAVTFEVYLPRVKPEADEVTA